MTPIQSWRRTEAERLLHFAARARVDDRAGGFGWLGSDGVVVPTRGRELYLNARMTYVFATAARLLDPAWASHAEHGAKALAGAFRDREYDGWFSALDADGRPADTGKATYAHAFVVLAGAALSQAEIAGGETLLQQALAVHETLLWDGESGWVRERRSRDWQVDEPYRGANAAMHSVEAWLAATAATGDRHWMELAARQSTAVLAATDNDRVVEHFGTDLTPLPDFNLDQPRDPFRPFGATPGHAFEWSRLLLELDTALGENRFRSAALALFDRAVADVEATEPGIPYTTDWSGKPVVEERFHWVMAEAVQAAEAWRERGHPTAAVLADRWWAEIREFFIDPADGSWIHELSPSMGPSGTTWPGRPDAYHALNALLGQAHHFDDLDELALLDPR